MNEQSRCCAMVAAKHVRNFCKAALASASGLIMVRLCCGGGVGLAGGGAPNRVRLFAFKFIRILVQVKPWRVPGQTTSSVAKVSAGGIVSALRLWCAHVLRTCIAAWRGGSGRGWDAHAIRSIRKVLKVSIASCTEYRPCRNRSDFPCFSCH